MVRNSLVNGRGAKRSVDLLPEASARNNHLVGEEVLPLAAREVNLAGCLALYEDWSNHVLVAEHELVVNVDVGVFELEHERSSDWDTFFLELLHEAKLVVSKLNKDVSKLLEESSNGGIVPNLGVEVWVVGRMSSEHSI